MKIFKPIELKIKESTSTKSLTKRNSSFSKATHQNHYASPYQKKGTSSDKAKAVTTFLAKTGRSSSTDNMKLKQMTIEPVRMKTKDTLLTPQVMKFQNTIPYKSTPSSPTSKKQPRPEIKITKGDNILTIRKKKLDALKEKMVKK